MPCGPGFLIPSFKIKVLVLTLLIDLFFMAFLVVPRVIGTTLHSLCAGWLKHS